MSVFLYNVCTSEFAYEKRTLECGLNTKWTLTEISGQAHSEQRNSCKQLQPSHPVAALNHRTLLRRVR